MLFEPNVGQWPANVLFEARTRDGRIHGLRDGFVMSRRTSQGWAAATLRFLEVSGVSTAEPSDQDVCRVNCYIGNDVANWFEGIPTYRKMRLRDLYDGVDLALRGEDGLFAFDLQVAPGVPTDRIRFRVVEEGLTTELVDGSRLVIRRDGEVFVRLMPPMSFQLDDGRSRPVASRFVEHAPGVFGFDVLRRDPALPLVIDPVVALFSTFLGGGNLSFADLGRGVAVDTQGRVYVAETEHGYPVVNSAASILDVPGPGMPGVAPFMLAIHATDDGNRTAVVGLASKDSSKPAVSSFPVLNAEQPGFGGGPSDATVFSIGEPEILVGKS